MQWTKKKKQRALIAALGIILLSLVGILVSCNRPTPAPATTTVTATMAARTATPTSEVTLTPSSPPHAQTPVPRATSTYLATAWPATWTAIPTATALPTATATAATTAVIAPTPTVVPLDPHTGVAHVSSAGIALAQLIALTGGLVLLFGILYRKVGRRK